MEIGFFLKKFVSFFLEPLGFVTLLFALGLYYVSKRRRFYGVSTLLSAVLLLLLFAYPPFASWLITPLEESFRHFEPKSEHQKIRYIHVLGSGHVTDEAQGISSQLSPAGVKRVLEGVLLHRALPQTKLIFTGYEGDTKTSNAQMNAKLALALGVKKENIIINGAPKDTEEEAIFARSLIAKERFILVTSASHMRRSLALFGSLGMHPLAAATDFHKEEFMGYARAPRAYYLHISSVALHEYVGLLWSGVKGAFS